MRSTNEGTISPSFVELSWPKVNRVQVMRIRVNRLSRPAHAWCEFASIAYNRLMSFRLHVCCHNVRFLLVPCLAVCICVFCVRDRENEWDRGVEERARDKREKRRDSKGNNTGCCTCIIMAGATFRCVQESLLMYRSLSLGTSLISPHSGYSSSLVHNLAMVSHPKRIPSLQNKLVFSELNNRYIF